MKLFRWRNVSITIGSKVLIELFLAAALLKGYFFSKKYPLKLPHKNSNVGNDLTVLKQLRHQRIKSFTRFFSKKSCGSRGAWPLGYNSQDMFWLCNRFQSRRRLMATIFHELKRRHCRLFICRILGCAIRRTTALKHQSSGLHISIVAFKGELTHYCKQ